MNSKDHFKTYILIITSLLSGFFVFFPIADGDIFWHLSAGREILNSGKFLFTDPFSYTTSSIPWIDLHWLFQVITYLIYSYSGYYGLLIVKALIIAFAVFLLLSPARSCTSLTVTAFFFIFCIYHFRYLVPLRPGIFTLLYLSSFLFLLEKYSKKPKNSLLVTLIPLQILWNNTQGLFMIGPAIVAIYIAGELTDQIRQSKQPVQAVKLYIVSKPCLSLATVFFALCISGIITPYGIRGLLIPLRLFLQITPGQSNQYSNLIAENTPMLKMIGTDQVFYVFVFAFLCAFTFFSIFVARGKTRSRHLYLFASFTVLALMAQRNLILLLFATIPLFNYNIDFLKFKTDIAKKRVFIYVIILFISIYFTIVTNSHFQMIKSVNNPISPFCHPLKSTYYLATHPLKGNIFNADRYGGYLLWNLYPSQKVYIDTRLSMRSRAFFSNYISLLDNPNQFSEIADRYSIHAVVLPAFIPLYEKLICDLYFNPNWTLVLTDGSETLFIRKELFSGTGIDLENQVQIDSLFRQIQIDSDFGSKPIKTEATFRLNRFIQNIRSFSFPNVPRSDIQNDF